MASGSLAHRLAVICPVGIAGSIEHRPLGVVHRSGHQSCERQGDVVFHLVHIRLAPFHRLQAMHALNVQDIRPGPCDSCRLVGPVQIKHKSVLCCSLRRTIVETGHQTVVPVHKVHLESLHAHFSVMAADILHIPFKCGISCPQYYPDILRCGIVHDSLHVNFRIDLQEVLSLADSPAVIKNHVFNAVGRCKINVIFVGLRVDARLEVHSVEIPVVPPVPGYLAGFDPGNILNARRFGQKPSCIALCNLDVGPDDGSPPRESPRCIHCHKEVLIFIDLTLDVVVTSVNDRLGARSEHGFKRICRISLVQVHPRVTIQVDVRYADFHSLSGIHQKRQKGKSPLIEPGNRGHGVKIFKRIEELAPEIPVSPFLDIRQGDGPVLREIVGNLLPADFKRFGKCGCKTVGHGVFIYPELQ